MNDMVSRRNVLATSVAGLSSLAGCVFTGGDGDDSDGQGTPTQTTVETTSGMAQFSEVAIDAPETPSIDGAVEITVSAANSGGEVGTFEAAVQVSGPEQLTEPVTITDVDAGEVGETTLDLDVRYAGTYTVRLEGTDAQAEVSVQPREATVGESAAVDDALQVRVDTTRVQSTLIAEGPGPHYLAPPVPSILPAEDPAETVLLVVDGAVRNTGDEPRTFDPTPVSVEVGGDVEVSPSFYADMGRELSPGVPIAGARKAIDGPPLAGADVDPGESLEGWLLAPVPREVATQAGIDVAVQRDGEGPPEARWEAVPEGGTDLPKFEAANLSLPDRVPNLTTQEFSLEVTNTGDAGGTFRDVLNITSLAPEFDPAGRITGEVAPGETVELTSEFFMAWGNRQGFRLQRSSLETAWEDDGVEFEGGCMGDWLELGFGESATLTNGVTVTVGSPVYNEGLSYGSGPEFGRSTRALILAATATLPEWAQGEGLGQQMLPALDEFKYKLDKYDPVPPLRIATSDAREKAKKGGHTLNSPVRGDLYPISPPEDPTSGTLQGWMVLFNSEEGWPREERELQLVTTLKRGEDDDAEKFVGIKWAQKFE